MPLRQICDAPAMPPPRTNLSPTRSHPHPTSHARTSDWVMNQPTVTTLQSDTSNLAASTAHVTTAANTCTSATSAQTIAPFAALSSIPNILSIAPSVLSRTTTHAQSRINPYSTTQSNVLNLDTRNYSQQTFNSQPFTSVLGLTSSHIRPIAHTISSSPSLQLTPPSSIQAAR